MVVEIITLLACFALVLVSYDRLAAMLLMVALRADATRVSTPDAASEAVQSQLGDLRHAVPSIGDGTSAPGVARPGLNGLKLTEGNEA